MNNKPLGLVNPNPLDEELSDHLLLMSRARRGLRVRVRAEGERWSWRTFQPRLLLLPSLLHHNPAEGLKRERCWNLLMFSLSRFFHDYNTYFLSCVHVIRLMCSCYRSLMCICDLSHVFVWSVSCVCVIRLMCSCYPSHVFMWSASCVHVIRLSCAFSDWILSC